MVMCLDRISVGEQCEEETVVLKKIVILLNYLVTSCSSACTSYDEAHGKGKRTRGYKQESKSRD